MAELHGSGQMLVADGVQGPGHGKDEIGQLLGGVPAWVPVAFCKSLVPVVGAAGHPHSFF